VGKRVSARNTADVRFCAPAAGPIRRARKPPAGAGRRRRVLTAGTAVVLALLALAGGRMSVGRSASAAPVALGPVGDPVGPSREPHGAQLLGSPAVGRSGGGSPAPSGDTSAGRTDARPADVTIVAAGDLACPAALPRSTRQCQQWATSDLTLALHPDAVLPLGDNAYESGSATEFRTGYAPSWGRLDRIAHPVPGNHEYGYTGATGAPSGAAGYFGYFGERSHPLQPGCRAQCDSWYSWNLGDWHLIALDSQCDEIGGCSPGDRQYEWLVADLATAGQRCVLAYWHIPVFSSSQDHQPDMQAIYRLLDQQGVDVVLNGHGHFYERFAAQDAAGRADPDGVTQFVVGTGGRSFFPVLSTPAVNSRALVADTFGVLRMMLRSDGYRWAFEPVGRSGARDQGTARCH
jgi:acid phosphatase type 7